MLAQVVSRVRWHFRRSKARLQQPPDLRRFSDFENPFPRVSPGGYTKYYEKHGLPKPKPHPVGGDLPNPSSSTIVISTPKPRTLAPPLSIPTSSSQSSASPSSSSSPKSSQSLPSSTSASGSRQRTRTLSTIREGSASSLGCAPSTHAPNLSNTPSLRRRRARLLRTPSVERHFPATAPKVSVFPGASPAIDDSEFSSNESLQSHFSRTDDSINTPPTTIEEDGPLLFKIEKPYTTLEPFDRPESRSSYATARSNFGFD